MRKKHEVKVQNRAGIGKVVTGLVVGSVIGAAVSLLMAPASGEETRNRIKGEVKSIQNRAKAVAGNVEDRGREIVMEAKSGLDNAKEDIAERITRRKKSTAS